MHTQLIISLASNAYHHSVDNDEIHDDNDDDEGGDNIDDDVDMDDDDDDEIRDDNVHDDDANVYSFTHQSYYSDFLTFIITQSKVTITIRISL